MRLFVVIDGAQGWRLAHMGAVLDLDLLGFGVQLLAAAALVPAAARALAAPARGRDVLS
jgi:hypothetical protein